jgi:RNA polymerase sigma factor (sigma-70 family)
MTFSDETLIKQCLDGDSSAFGFLIDKYKGAVHALAYHKIGNYHDAEEITQETFLKAYQRLSTLRNTSGFAGWLYVICANCCYDWIRKWRKENVLPLDQLPRTEVTNLSYARYSDNQIDESVRDALNALSESERTIVTLQLLGGLSCDEISRFLGISLSAAKMRLSRAKNQLKKEITEMLEQTWSKSQLGSGFTFQLMETIQRLSPFGIPEPNIKKWIPIVPLIMTLTIAFGSFFISSTIPPFSFYSLAGNARIAFLELLQQDEEPQINIPVVLTTNIRQGEPTGSGPDKNNQSGKTSALGLSGISNKDEEQESANTINISGFVLQNGMPKAGVQVYAVIRNSLQAKTISQSDGTYQFDNLPMPKIGWTHNYMVFACIDKQAIGWNQPTMQGGGIYDKNQRYITKWTKDHLDIQLDKEASIDDLFIQLFPTEHINGVVKDEAGFPIKDATIRVIGMDYESGYVYISGFSFPSKLPCFPPITTDEDGNFTIYNVRNTTTLQVEKERYATTTVHEIPARSPLSIILKPAGRIEGRVIDSVTNKPAEGISLYCGEMTTSTSSDGKYSFGKLSAGGYNIGLAESLPDRTAAIIQNVSVQHGKTTQAPDINLVKGGVISGEVTTKDVKPTQGVTIYFDSPYGGGSATTDSKGEYHFRAVPGRVTVRLPDERIIAKSYLKGEFDVEDGKDIDSVDFTYTGTKVNGVIVTTDAKPVSGALIYQLESHDGMLNRMPLIKSRLDGTFSLPQSYPEGKMLMLSVEKITAGLQGSAVIIVDRDNPVRIVMSDDKLKRVYGRIINISGEPMPNYDVGIWLGAKQGDHTNWTEFKTTKTNEDGWFDVSGLEDGADYSVMYALSPTEGFIRAYQLFDIGLEFKNSLNNKEITSELRQQFKNNGITLSDKTTIQLEGDKWAIIDNKQPYMIVKEMDTLKIYIPPSNQPSVLSKVTPGLQKALDNKKATPELKEVLKSKGILLSDSAAFLSTGGRWVITDNGRTYIIGELQNKILVYPPPSLDHFQMASEDIDLGVFMVKPIDTKSIRQ